MSRRLPRVLAMVVYLALPAAVGAQCADELLQDGIRAYHEVDLESAVSSLRRVLSVSETEAPACSEERARALTYLGATHWFTGAPDSALAAFRRSVIQAPAFRADEMVFPPQITDLHDRARRTTPSVFVTPPDTAGERWAVGIGASTEHVVEVTVRPSGESGGRTLYRGPVTEEPEDTRVGWDGRIPEGGRASPGRYTLSVVSLDSLSTPLRALEIPLTVDVLPSLLRRGGPIVSDGSVPSGRPSGRSGSGGSGRASTDDSLWGVIGRAGAGLLGGGVVVALPWIVDDPPGSTIRYSVAGAVGVAGIAGLAWHFLDDEEPDPPQLVYPEVDPAGEGGRDGAEPAIAAGEGVVRIRAGAPERRELVPGGPER